MKTAIEAEEEYATAKNDRDPIVLLEIIRQILFDSNTKICNPYVTMRSAKRKLYTLFQINMSLDDYHKRFTSQIEVIEHLKGVIMEDNYLAKIEAQALATDKDNITNEETKKGKEIAKNKYLAVLFLYGLHNNKYGKLWEELENDYLAGDDKFPTTVQETYHRALYWKSEKKTSPQPKKPATTDDPDDKHVLVANHPSLVSSFLHMLQSNLFKIMKDRFSISSCSRNWNNIHEWSPTKVSSVCLECWH